MKTSLNNKYKDRDPMETVQIIKDFFKSEGYNLEVFNCEKTNAETYWCRIIIKDNLGNEILGQNGKGTTLEYCLASGYAELYERYCAGFHIRNFYEQYKYYQKEKTLIKNEKFLTFSEILNSSSRLFNAINFIDKKKKNYYLKTFALIYNENNKIPCTYFYNLDPKKKGAYFNDFLLLNLFGSDGTAAGNTIEEAITQGLSEVYEHYVAEQLFKCNKDLIFYELDLNQLSLSPYLLKMFYNIKNNDQINFHIFDLSYTFNMPVILGTFHNKKTNTWSMNLGASPIFEIALERVLTEEYQGTSSLNIKFQDKKVIMAPFRHISNIDRLLNNNSSDIADSDSLPEKILLNTKKINNYNNEIFLINNYYSNIELNQYFIELNKKNNFEVFIKDISKSEKIKAVRVYVANQDIFSFSYKYNKKWNSKLNFEVSKLFIEYLEDNKFNFKKYQKIKRKNIYLSNDPFPYLKINNIKLFKKQLKLLLYSNFFLYEKNYSKIKYFLYLNDYIIKKEYSFDEIKIIFNNILLINDLCQDDINNINKIEYWFKQLFLNNF